MTDLAEPTVGNDAEDDGAVSDATVRTHLRTCPLCEAMCGLEIQTTGDRVTRVRGDRADVWSKGYLCPKGAALGHLHHDPDRVRAPMVRDGETWREVSWDEAFARCEELVRPILERDGISAITAYIGNPAAHTYSLGRYTGAVVGIPRMPMIWSAGTVDQWPKNVACAQLFGNPWSLAVPDIHRTDLFVVMGANPHASNGSLFSCPDILGEIDRIRERGGRTIVIDPRRTGTAERADEWISIIPGMDAALLLAVVNVLDTENLVRLGALEGRVRGIDEVFAVASDFTPEAVEDACGVPAERIRQLARELATTERAVVYGRIGLCNQEFGTLASWAVDVVNVLTGHLDVVGGAMFPTPAIAAISRTARRRGPMKPARWHTRVRQAPEVLGQAPLSCLAEEISTPGEGRVRGLVVMAGNPALSAPDAGKLEAALPMLDAMISVDNWLNETSRHAHVILPGLSALEQPHCDEALWAFAVRSAVRWSPAIFPQDRPQEWEILIRLGGILAGIPAADVDVEALDDMLFAERALRHGVAADDVAHLTTFRGPDRIVDLTVRMSPWGDGYGARPGGLTLESLMHDHPHGIDFGPMVPCIDEIIRTASGDVELAHDNILGDVPRLAERIAQPRPNLVLIGRRHVRSNNSWMHNVNVLVKGRPRCTLIVHPKDAEDLGVVDGAMVSVTSEVGTVHAAVEISDEIRQGVVSLPHGWGHDRTGTRLAVAEAHAGVNSNLLAPGTLVDVPSGNAAVNGFPVQVVRLRSA
ncbi:MAG: Formate dehydrogenase-O, major subunit [Ilumatobacteraceae bacterium]|nr:Formate dehydrogenase-O, major subunit [Ilumatobacteraceae bacterium]